MFAFKRMYVFEENILFEMQQCGESNKAKIRIKTFEISVLVK